MLIHEGDARSAEADRRLAFCLAGIAGALNASGFYAVGLYASNMTGNVSAMADRIAEGDLGLAAIPLVLVGLFVSGAFTSTLLVDAGRRRHLRGIYAYSILLEAVLLLGWSGFGLAVPAAANGPPLVLGLSFLMGLQNATVTQISNARVRTTHVTGMVTDIGIELAHLFDLRRERRARDLRNAAKLGLHLGTVASFLLGGIAGVATLRSFGGGPLMLLAAVLLLLLAAPAIRAAQLPRIAPAPIVLD